ncbi:hypothetical protein [Acinetobacter towneri]|uniref:hypothetical protein n=1 Tax=Acinetobacter towneri TaxID=202956 RepID=UPI001F1BFCA2|nr:hypothetical protein [Acinetobacter towneri]UIP24970.1 hypothetical protein LZG54_12810 [Acinetobacter towneri]
MTNPSVCSVQFAKICESAALAWMMSQKGDESERKLSYTQSLSDNYRIVMDSGSSRTERIFFNVMSSLQGPAKLVLIQDMFLAYSASDIQEKNR